VSYTKKPPIGSIGIAAVPIAADKWGEVFFFYFPYAAEKNKAGTYRVHALSDVFANKTVIIVDANCGCVQQSESNPTATVRLALDDYAEINFGAVEVEYDIGTNAHTADPAVPLFMTTQLSLFATTGCFVRFNSKTRVQHHLQPLVPYSFPLNVTSLFVIQDLNAGTLFVDAIGAAS
jgi:hypothetical protein